MQLNQTQERGRLRRPARRLARLGRDQSALALIEFAYSLPILLTLGMYGTELAYMATVDMQVSQVAMALADNASRLGQTDNSAVAPTITNGDIDSVTFGAMQQGASISFQQNGRVILSSLEVDGATGRQFIRWQRCRGDFARNSAYGPAGYGLNDDPIPGLGKPGQVVAAQPTTAVMFVEAFYRYDALFGTMFVKDVEFAQEAAFIIRDDRNLTAGVTGAAGASMCTVNE
jgi:hypothetical protein